ncbi:MAG: sulfotransferase [Sphingomicrobium sp.]
MKLFVVGFPKAGTTTLTTALEASGMNPVHWGDSEGRFVGQVIYDNVLAGRDPLATLEDHDSVTQADVCLPAHKINFWPNLDFAILSAIRAAHPQCLFLLNHRDSEKLCQSIDRWPALRERLVESDIPGLPAGKGGTDLELICWIENHYAACRRFFAGDPAFLELSIGSPDTPERLGRALGIEIRGWGHTRPLLPRDEDILEMVNPTKRYKEFKAGPGSKERPRPMG